MTCVDLLPAFQTGGARAMASRDLETDRDHQERASSAKARARTMDLSGDPAPGLHLDGAVEVAAVGEEAGEAAAEAEAEGGDREATAGDEVPAAAGKAHQAVRSASMVEARVKTVPVTATVMATLQCRDIHRWATQAMVSQSEELVPSIPNWVVPYVRGFLVMHSGYNCCLEAAAKMN
mmetsp:Transcript_5652/g.12417  ORF Transcript_5652/g.12417 Transcript_5652/m.12417 type:complete len:178 (-) Transcript_5652:25-558(-)